MNFKFRPRGLWPWWETENFFSPTRRTLPPCFSAADRRPFRCSGEILTSATAFPSALPCSFRGRRQSIPELSCISPIPAFALPMTFWSHRRESSCACRAFVPTDRSTGSGCAWRRRKRNTSSAAENSFPLWICAGGSGRSGRASRVWAATNLRRSRVLPMRWMAAAAIIIPRFSPSRRCSPPACSSPIWKTRSMPSWIFGKTLFTRSGSGVFRSA